jgi:hypothetical protein
VYSPIKFSANIALGSFDKSSTVKMRSCNIGYCSGESVEVGVIVIVGVIVGLRVIVGYRVGVLVFVAVNVLVGDDVVVEDICAGAQEEITIVQNNICK